MQAVIKQARECKTSAEMYEICEDLSHRLSDAKERLVEAEYEGDWDRISGCVTTVAYWKYLYDTIYDWAESMNETETHLSDLEWEMEMDRDAIRTNEDRIQKAKEMERW